MAIYSNDHKRITTLNTLLDVSLQKHSHAIYILSFSAVKIEN